MRCENVGERLAGKSVECVTFQIRISCAYKEMANESVIFPVPVCGK
jgi:hypothetical protein